jgi:DivIVA domain-containing protein
MALTPEQILNKHFQTTQFRKGYDERDVDDFLDDVVAEMRALTAQRDDYKHQFEECQSRSSTVASNRAPVDAGVLEEHERRLEDVRSRIAEAEATEKEVGERLITAQAEVAAAEAQVRDRQGAIDASVQERLDAAEGRARAESEAKAAAEQKVLQLENELRQTQQRATEAQGQAQQAEQTVGEARKRAEDAEARAGEAERRASEAAQAQMANTAAAMPAAQTDDSDGSGTGVMRAVAGGAVGGTSAAALIELAQRVHDEHVGKGETRRDELVQEGQRKHDELLATAQARHDELMGTAQTHHDELMGTAQTEHDRLLAEATERHEQLITEGRERSTGMVAEAQQKKAAVLAELEQEKSLLEKKIDQLRGFERTYRSQLKSYLQGQLDELDSTGVEPHETGAENAEANGQVAGQVEHH